MHVLSPKVTLIPRVPLSDDAYIVVGSMPTVMRVAL